MPLTAVQAQRRATRIGASDIAVIVMGPRFPWRKHFNQKSLFLEKTGKTEPQDETWAMRAGNYAEVALLAYAANHIGPVDRRNAQIRHPNGVMIATLDGRLKGEQALIECKAPGLVSFWGFDRDRWGDTDTPVRCAQEAAGGIVPEEYYWQVQAQLSCVNAHIRAKNDPAIKEYTGAFLVALLAGTSVPFRHYWIQRNDPEIALMEEAVCSWWDDYICTGTPPDDLLTLETSARVIRNQEGWVTVPDQLFQNVITAKAAEKAKSDSYNAVKKLREETEAALLDAGGQHTLITCPAGHTLELVTTQVNPKPHQRTSKKYDFADPATETTP